MNISYYTRINVDELKLQYAIIKAMKGYGTSFSEKEFKDFLSYYEGEIKKEKKSFSITKLSRKKPDPYGYTKYFDVIINNNNIVYKLNYNLNTSFIQNIYFNSLDIDFLHTKVHKKDATNAQRIIKEYLEKFEDKKVENTNVINGVEKAVSIAFASRLVNQMKNYFITKRVDIANRRINKTEEDLMYCTPDISLVKLPESINNEFSILYNILCERIANLYHEDNNAIISSNINEFLARVNYDRIFEGYTEFANEVFGTTLKIDFGKLNLKINGEVPNLAPNEIPKIKNRVR